MFKKHLLSLLGGFVALNAFAGTMGIVPAPVTPSIEIHPWSVTGSLGYTSYESGTAGTGQTPVGRLAIGKSFCDFGQSSFGVELGVQNGNTMRLFAPQDTIDVLAAETVVTTTITPMLDLLGTLRVSFFSNVAAFLEFKAGAAYRRLYVINRADVGNKYQFAGEVQAGAGVPITDSSTLSLLYQGVYGGSADFTASAVSLTGSVKNIPVQNGLLLSLNITL